MFHPHLPALHHTRWLAPLAADDLRHGEFYSLFGVQPDGVSLDFGEEVVCSVWSDWSGSNLPVFDV
jgi:hypothetical protein